MNRVLVYHEDRRKRRSMDCMNQVQRDALYNMVCLACEGLANETMRRLWEENRRKSEFVYKDMFSGMYYTILADRNSGQVRIYKAEAVCAVSAKAA